jgi:hypothetical protein
LSSIMPSKTTGLVRKLLAARPVDGAAPHAAQERPLELVRILKRRNSRFVSLLQRLA